MTALTADGALLGSTGSTRPRTLSLQAALGAVPELALVTSLGLLLIALADVAARSAHWWASVPFWIGLLTVVAPIGVRLLGTAARRGERITLLVLLAVALYLVKVLHSPAGFSFFDEFHHWLTLEHILASGHLFTPNNILPASPYYPGLEVVTAPLVSFGFSAWEAGVVILAVARVLFVVALFLFFEQIVRDARLAGLATLVYMANPGFIIFDAQFAYESLALPLAAFVLWAVVRRERGPRPGRVGLTACLLVGLLAVVTTHHVTSVALSALLVVWAAVSWWVRHRTPSDAPGVTGPALLAVTATAGWMLYVASVTVGYLAPAFGGALGQVADLIQGEATGRELFRAPTGAVAPLWEQVTGYGVVALIVITLPIGLWLAWQRMGRDPAALALMFAALLYPASLVGRLTQAGAELSARSVEFVFLGIGFVLAFALVWLTDRVPAIAPRRIVLRAIAVGAPAGLAALFVGGMILGVPAWARLPGPYLVSADPRSIEPQGIAAASWTAAHLAPDSRFMSDRINRVLLATYGRQHPISAAGDRIDIRDAYFSTTLGGPEVRLLQAGRVRYVLADMRLTTALPTVGVYIERGEIRSGAHVVPLDADALTKWDTVTGIDRIFDSGDIVMYDVARVLEPGE